MAVFVIICPPVTNSEMKGWRGKGGKKFFCLLTTLTRFTIFAIFTLLYDFYMITSFTLHGKLTIYIVLFHLTVFYQWIHRPLNIRTDVSQNRVWKWRPKRHILAVFWMVSFDVENQEKYLVCPFSHYFWKENAHFKIFGSEGQNVKYQLYFEWFHSM